MAALRLEEINPRKTVSEKVTPAPLRQALKQIFSDIPEGLWLVGGTALAGYYAEHRRSDDLDLFAGDPDTHQATVLSVKRLKKIGAIFEKEKSTPNFYKGHLQLKGHSFTVDVVLDENLHQVGRSTKTEDGVRVVALPTIFAMKAACLLSRCSEKDLYDLAWCFDQTGEIDVAQLVEKGSLVDGGMNVEGMLISLQGAVLRKDACHFLLDDSNKAVDEAYRKIADLQKRLIHVLLDYERGQPLSQETKALADAVKDQKKIR